MHGFCKVSLDTFNPAQVKVKQPVPITTECQDSVSEREAVCGSYTEYEGNAERVESRGHPAIPGRGAGLLGWIREAEPANCCRTLLSAGPETGQVFLYLPQPVLGHLNSLMIKARKLKRKQ